MYLQFSKVCEIWVLLNVTEWVFHCGADFACIFSLSGFANFESHWMQLNGFFISVPIFMYFQFSRVCEFPVKLRATEWVFHYSANFHVSSVQQGLWNLSLIECNWMGFSFKCQFSCIFSSSGFVNFESHWVQLNELFISVPIFMYFQFSKVCEFPVTLRATEWVFH